MPRVTVHNTLRIGYVANDSDVAATIRVVLEAMVGVLTGKNNASVITAVRTIVDMGLPLLAHLKELRIECEIAKKMVIVVKAKGRERSAGSIGY